MGLLLFVVFIVVPILELAAIIQIGQAIGVLPTIALLIADSVLGAALMRSQGRAAWRRFNGALAEGRVPGREVMDGALVIFGGALLLTPGFLSDVLGLILLLPPTRAIVRKVLVARYGSRLVATAASGAGSRVFGFGTGRSPRGAGGYDDAVDASGGRSPRRARGYDDVVDASATEVDPPRTELP